MTDIVHVFIFTVDYGFNYFGCFDNVDRGILKRRFTGVGVGIVPRTIPQMSVYSLQVLHPIMTMVADKTLVLFRVKVLITSLGGHPVLGSKPTLGGVEMIMHSVHGTVGDVATVADKFILLLPVKLSVTGLGRAPELLSKTTFCRVQMIVHSVNGMVSGSTTKTNANFILLLVKFHVISLRTCQFDPVGRSLLRLGLREDKDGLDLELVWRQFATFLVVEVIVNPADGFVSLTTTQAHEFVVVSGVVASEVFLRRHPLLISEATNCVV